MKRPILLPAARAEIYEAARFYEQRVTGLGRSLVGEARRAISWIVENPIASPVLLDEIRKKVLLQFPYSIFYRVDARGVVIVAFSHQSRRPSYWRDRLR